jgi:thymidylate synthase
MALHIRQKSIAFGWLQLLGTLLGDGKEYQPRGLRTKEILNVTLEIEDGLNNILVSKTRDLNYRFMIAEWLWIQAGLNDVESLAIYNSVMRKFSDDDQILSGAYGPRLMPQLPYILETLRKPDSRQAVATIWTPNPSDSKDIPCTISLQWMVRGGKLHCTANMRSSDVWLGLPYDFFTFSQLTNLISSRLGIEVGSVTMNLASSHIYSTNWMVGTEASVQSNVENIRSPQFTPDVMEPTQEEIKRILSRRVHPLDLEVFDSPWREYTQSLTNNKKSCLEVLRGLSSIRETIKA